MEIVLALRAGIVISPSTRITLCLNLLAMYTYIDAHATDAGPDAHDLGRLRGGDPRDPCVASLPACFVIFRQQ